MAGPAILRQGAAIRPSAPFIFNEAADTFQWICEHHLSIQDMLHLLDDFLLAGPPRLSLYQDQLDLALRMCAYLGLPTDDEKTTLPSIVLDTVCLESCLPEDKRQDLLTLLTEMADKRRCMPRGLQHLLGKLKFASCVAVPGKTFTRQLYDTTHRVTQPYHHVRLSEACCLDLL